MLYFYLGSKIYSKFDIIAAMPGGDIAWNCFKISGGAFLAFALELMEYLLICKTSSLTLSVSGIFKVN